MLSGFSVISRRPTRNTSISSSFTRALLILSFPIASAPMASAPIATAPNAKAPTASAPVAKLPIAIAPCAVTHGVPGLAFFRLSFMLLFTG
ncbi:MAG: hypothetical protein EOP47_21850 [Sphingobacteriaceae bacterium]|nr:MAG: hypothetical protein EOP47_21850 [Sphingobacteriaceae bacterium]